MSHSRIKFSGTDNGLLMRLEFIRRPNLKPVAAPDEACLILDPGMLGERGRNHRAAFGVERQLVNHRHHGFQQAVAAAEQQLLEVSAVKRLIDMLAAEAIKHVTAEHLDRRW